MTPAASVQTLPGVSSSTSSSTLPHKLSVLIYVANPAGDVLLMERRRSPNIGLWSPIGGKLETGCGESPHEAARRETAEEIGLQLEDDDLHLFAMIAEKNYEARVHWLMFAFASRKTIDVLPPPIEEGAFRFVPLSEIDQLPIPETDRDILWPLYHKKRSGFTALRADCTPGTPPTINFEETIGL